MKSKQINFFSVDNDLPYFEEYFRRNDILFIKLPFVNKDNFILKNGISQKHSDGEWAKVYLTKAEFLNYIDVEYINQQNYFLVNDIVSPVIEFVRPIPDTRTGIIERSRLYYVESFFQGSKLIKKDESFLKWAKGLCKDFEKSFLVKVKQSKEDRYTENVLRMIDEGVIKESLPLRSFFRIESKAAL